MMAVVHSNYAFVRKYMPVIMACVALDVDYSGTDTEKFRVYWHQ